MNNQIVTNYYAEIYFPGDLPEIQVPAMKVYEKISNGDTEPLSLKYGFVYANGKLSYTGQQEFPMMVSLLVRIAHKSTEERTLKITCSRNGIICPASEKMITAKGQSTFKTVNALFELLLSPNDEIEWWVGNENGTEKIMMKDLKYTFSKK